MAMYDELIKALRGFENYDGLDLFENRTYAQEIAREAANAIEELSKELIELKMLTCCCCEPPKEET